MKRFNKTITVKEVRNSNITKESVLGKDFQWDGKNDNYYLTVDGKLEIHKSTTGLQEEMLVFPRVTNVIDVK